MTKKRPFLLRAFGLLYFVAAFLKELLVANWAVAKVVLFQPRSSLAPGFLDYDLTGLTSFEIVVLTHCITLTPGTASVEVSDDHRTLVIHALDVREPEAVRQGIKNQLEAPLLRWTR